MHQLDNIIHTNLRAQPSSLPVSCERSGSSIVSKFLKECNQKFEAIKQILDAEAYINARNQPSIYIENELCTHKNRYKPPHTLSWHSRTGSSLNENIEQYCTS